jgi:glycosyltransferase involved in cell wall biosynthesis
MKTSIITPIYNNLELCQQTVESVLSKTTGEFEYILVDNHALDKRSREYIRTIERDVPNVQVIDTGMNNGCHKSINIGIVESHGEYIVKLDDDTVIDTVGWNEIMIRAFDEFYDRYTQNIAFLAPDSNVKQGTTNIKQNTEHFRFEIVTCGVLGFSLVMIPRNIYNKFGPLESKFWKDGEIKLDSLYGGEELYYCTKARQYSYEYGYIMDVQIKHLGNEFRDPDYVAWKYGGGYMGWFSYDLEELKKHKDMLIKVYKYWIDREKSNQWYVDNANKKLKEFSYV